MRVVVDCNVVISAGLTAGVCREVVYDIVRRHEVVFSADVLREYVEVSHRRKFQGSRDLLEKLIRLLAQEAMVTNSAPCGVSLPDAKDVMYLDLAIASGAAVIITGNKRHFPEADYQGVRIISPRAFLEL